ncbi:hypothetical protein FIE12Z_10728 [Fusarium flagelliforme]|uniref:Arrestin-like N-terminal domain-containing protein n=1 Tax=Fusarium flagelliforme TaxID=2675880 RepID=A0A395MB08_9HYPO|nr:hypothetical protein FIE12Z_10728 [Fusarium flagelliforme]
MSIRIALNNQPEFYTNLDFISGRVILGINRNEQIGSIVVKLEGESGTALQAPNAFDPQSMNRLQAGPQRPPGSMAIENHKILYKLQQVFPDDYYASSSNPYGAYPLQAGEHEFPFNFKLPINNACSDPMAMSKIGGMSNVGGFGGGGIFGIGGVRVMDGSKQLYLRHVTRTLPPSLTGYPGEAEIRYYIKVTIQRPGLLKENWRYNMGLKFLPIEPPRPQPTSQEAFARRPFTFRPQSPQPEKKRSSLFNFGSSSESKTASNSERSADTAPAPAIEISARLPHPSILTCNKPIPLRLIAKKLNNNPEQVYLVSFQMELIGRTDVRALELHNQKINRWVVVSNPTINIPLTTGPDDEVGKELVIPDHVWKSMPLPNTVAPSFATCNLSRKYELEIKLGVAWGQPKKGLTSKSPPVILLPLHFAQIEVYSGITPPAELVEAARSTRPGRATFTNNTPPRLPPRQNSVNVSPQQQQPQRRPSQTVSQAPPQPAHDPLYPPQLAPGQEAPPYDDAPPSYDEAVAENLAGPFDGMQSRPAYSGVTNENAPSQLPPEKS